MRWGMGMPIPIVNPHNITKFLGAYRSMFSKPQYAHFERYVLGLIASEKGGSNITDINDLYVDRCHQSSLNRFLTRSPWDVEEVNKTRLRVLQHGRRTRSRRNGYLILDDVLISKTGRCMSGVGLIFSKSEGRSVLGHNFVSTHYSDERGQYPVDLRMYIKEELAEPMGVEFKTKIEIAIDLINSAVDNGVSANTVAFDTWYFAKELIDAIEREWTGLQGQR
ncbi:MAG: transposase [Methanocellales archaeon]|nr:transposase [Methanocellales archaeon]